MGKNGSEKNEEEPKKPTKQFQTIKNLDLLKEKKKEKK